jgi:putative drug exporter of the RND superfamily
MLSSLASVITRRSRTVLALCLVIVAASAVVAVGVFARLGTAGYDDPASDSSRATALLNREFGGQPDLIFLVRATDGTVDDAAARASGVALTGRLAHEPTLSGVSSYFTAPAPALKSRDGTEAVILAHVTGSPNGIDERTGEILDRYNHSSDGATSVLIGGPRGADLGRQSTKDVALAESIAIPVTLVLLLLVFGSVVAALLPLAVALFAMITTAATLYAVTGLTDVSVFAINLITALGLGLSVDYALLLVSRYREEISGGATVPEAIGTTLNTAGRTIVFSGVTVVAALAALLAFPPYFLKSFAYAGIGVVVFAVVAALVLLPALLVVLGPRVDAWALPWRRNRRAPRPDTFWTRLVTVVMRRPVRIGLPILLGLLAVSAPLFHLALGNPDDRVLPAAAPAHQVGQALREDFATDTSGAMDVVLSNAPASAVSDYATRLSALPGVADVQTSLGTWSGGRREAGAAARPDLNAGGYQRVVAAITSDPVSAPAKATLRAARALPVAAGADALITGPTAQLIDNTAAVTDYLPLAGGIVLVTTLVMLFLLTGSIVHPVRALLSNAVSLAATMGIAVRVFQDGDGSSVLGFTPGPLSLSILVLTACVAFGLSMDYEVFLMSRIKEARDGGQSSAEAVVTGITRTGRIITSCAALLAVSFFAFATADVSLIQVLGLSTGLAILIDATLVRAVLVPAFLSLTGDRAWYAPRILRRVHERLGISEHGTVHRPATADPSRQPA